MFKHLFATMNEALEDIIRLYPMAVGAKKRDLDEQLNALRAMSDACIEEWLQFEEKMGQFNGEPSAAAGIYPDLNLLETGCAAADKPGCLLPELTFKPQPAQSEAFRKGQGFFNLMMFQESIREFERVVAEHPEFLTGKLYLALGHLKMGHLQEAYRMFQFIVQLAEDPKMKAISYNAMGCIQVKNQNMEAAKDYFMIACTMDPTLVEPIIHMNVSLHSEGSMN